jgi:RNA-directed DNA polymerase
MESLTRFRTAKLKLKVNQQKSAVARPWERIFWAQLDGESRTETADSAPKRVLRFKGPARELTSRAGCQPRTDG